MLADYFQLSPIPPDQMTGTYDLRMVVLSYLVAIFASYIALDITGRLRDVNNSQWSKSLWIVGGAFAMGAGIWSMHFIGMLAFSMPGMVMSFEPFWTGLSLVVAIVASGFALYLLKIRIIRIPQLALGGVIFGFAIVTMHYLGMQAMKSDVDIHFLPGLYILSILIAIFASEAALWLALKSNQVVPQLRVRLKIISALIMGAAICGMHYTGMAAAVFTPLSHAAPSNVRMDPEVLAISIAVCTFVIMGIAFFVSAYKEALNQQLIEGARQAGMAEVAVSVLHNVGNVLNSLYVSSNIVAEKIKKSRLSELNDLSQIFTEHQQDLSAFFKEDPRSSKIPVYINTLAKYWQDEQTAMTAEMEIVTKNLQHIKEIITVQQDLSKNSALDQIVAIDHLLEEAILLVGFDYNRHKIELQRKYEKLSPIVLNKIKLVQVLVNILHNAKDALADTSVKDKLLTLQIGKVNEKTIFIRIADSGVGILPKNMSQMFMHGFTTKSSGHGFGLHASALSLKEMGGSITVESDGLGRGATFTLLLPYKLPRR